MRESAAGPRMSLSALNNVDDPDRQVRIWLLSSLDVKGTTYYRVAGRFTSSGQTWQVNRRYSEFLMLRDTLVKFFSRSTDTCPGCLNYLHAIEHFDFPKKHVFVSKSALVINYRVKALRAFLNLLASWSFSNAPKCPTCGGFAFDIVRNFVLEGAEAIGDSSMGYIRDSFVVSTFTDTSRRSSFQGTPALERRDSFIPASGSSKMLAQRRQEQDAERMSALERRKTMSSLNQGRKPEMADTDAYETFNDYLVGQPSQLRKTASMRSAINVPMHAENEDHVSHASTAPRAKTPAIHPATAANSSSTASAHPASVNGSFLFYQDGIDGPTSSTSSNSRTATTKQGSKRGILKNRDEYIPRHRAQNESYISLGASSTSADVEEPATVRYQPTARANDNQEYRRRIQNDSYVSLGASSTSAEAEDRAGVVYHSHHPSVIASPSATKNGRRPEQQHFFDSFVSEDNVKFDGVRPNVADGDSDDDEIDVTGVMIEPPPLSRRKSTSGEGLWQPWELAKAS